EGLSIGQIADRLGRSPATVKAYFYDPTGEKARAVKARYVGVCHGCGAYTQPRNGSGARSRPGGTPGSTRRCPPSGRASTCSPPCAVGGTATGGCQSSYGWS